MTWNPVTGCLHGCEYCYARKIANRFAGKAYKQNKDIFAKDFKATLEIPDRDKAGHIISFPHGFLPTFHQYRLGEPAKIQEPQKIFVCSMADLFGDWVPDEWIEEVFKACEDAPWHTYMFLTKNPSRYFSFKPYMKDNYMFGCTTGDKICDKTVYNGDGSFIASDVHCDSDIMGFFQNSFLSLEPLRSDAGNDINLAGIDWVIIGQQTGPGAISPKDEWVQSIIDQCKEADIPVYVKSPLYEKFPVQELPRSIKVDPMIGQYDFD
jgi:protein gp37